MLRQPSGFDHDKITFSTFGIATTAAAMHYFEKMIIQSTRLALSTVSALQPLFSMIASRHQYLIDGDVNDANHVANGSHDDESQSNGLAEFDEFSLICCNAVSSSS